MRWYLKRVHSPNEALLSVTRPNSTEAKEIIQEALSKQEEKRGNLSSSLNYYYLDLYTGELGGSNFRFIKIIRTARY